MTQEPAAVPGSEVQLVPGAGSVQPPFAALWGTVCAPAVCGQGAKLQVTAFPGEVIGTVP